MAEEEASTTLLVRQLIGQQQQLAAGLAKTDENVSKLALTVSQITASWKDKAVTQIGAVLLAALSVIGAQYALRPAIPPATNIVQRSELDIRAEGCAKMANGVPEAYARCMVDQVVAPGANRVGDSTNGPGR